MTNSKTYTSEQLPVVVSENVAPYHIETSMGFTVNVNIDLITKERTAEILEFNYEIDDWTGTPVEISEIADLVPTLLVPKI